MTVDHVVVGAPDLTTAAAQFAAYGLELEPGGRHPRHGTHNALVGLGADQYVEVVAADPAATTRSARGVRIAAITDVTLLEILLKAPADLTDARPALVDGPHPGERVRGDGMVLSWELYELRTETGAPLPDLIRWVSQHPAADLRPQGRLVEARLGVGDVEQARAALGSAGAADGLLVTDAAELRVTIVTTAGDRLTLRAQP